MAKCKGCGIDIPEGAEYCAECLSKLNTAKDSESYLDSLLSAVMTEEPKRREIVYPKREASSLVSVPEDRTPVKEAISVQEDIPVASEVAEASVQEDTTVASEVAAASVQEDTTVASVTATEKSDKREGSLEDAFDMFFDGAAELPDLKGYSIFGDVDEGTIDRMLEEDLGESGFLADATEETVGLPVDGSSHDGLFEGAFSAEEVFDGEEAVSAAEVGDIEDLFGMLEDERGENAPEEIEMGIPMVISAEDLDAAADTFSGIVEASEEEDSAGAFGDFADLFGGTEEGSDSTFEDPEPEDTATEEPVAAFGDFADLFGEGDVVQDAAPASSAADDFADLFSDGMFEFGAAAEEMQAEGENGAEPDVPVAAETSPETEEDSGKKEKKGRLSALFHRLFDNVKVDPSKIKEPPTKEEIEAKKKAKQEEKERSKEEKEALAAEKKEQEKQIKLEKQRVKKEAKAEKKAKKMEEAKLLLEEMEKTRINRAGASIVFIFFAMIAVIIVVGTSIFSYSLSIKNAEYEFENDRYTAAYNEIYGLEIKNEDILLYDRIMTVMYVQKQLNSYNNYYEMKDMPRALDSLLKGLQRYEKYIDLAVELEVDTDLDSVRKKILENVTSAFMLTEQEAMEIIQSDSQAEYSKKVYDAVDSLQ